jgi:2-polyprenyl-6-methoxyphenol hydroxylase-like FAD-dependent oxidoreductase
MLIVGGGIGGLALAGALGRRGTEVLVVDNQPEWSITRSGIVLQAPALRALRALGVIDAVLDAGFGMTAFRYHDATSTQRAESDLPRLAGPEYPGTIGVLRWPLHTILLAAVEESGVEVRLGTTVRALDGPEVELSDGSSARYDVVVGADGIRLRELAIAPHPTTPASSCGARCSSARPRSTSSTSTTRRARHAGCARSRTRRCTCSRSSRSPSSRACRPRTSPP